MTVAFVTRTELLALQHLRAIVQSEALASCLAVFRWQGYSQSSQFPTAPNVAL